MIDRSHLLARLMRRSRAEHPPDDEAARFDFDALARDLAAGLSRREAIRRLGVGLGGALLAALGLAPAAEAVTCPPPQIDCFGVCRNPQTDPKHCGRCGAACNVGHLCCNGVCKNPSNDKANCGGCGIVCAANQYCCSGRCVNPKTDPNHCGACLQACLPGQSCVNGVCLCPAGQVLCYGRCTDRATDENNCGGCGVRCAATHVCQSGQCRPCPSTTTLCVGTNGRTCCGSGLYCCGGQCSVCPCDQTLCTGSKGPDCCEVGETCCDGACVNAQMDVNNCGGCGTTCAGGEKCSGGICCTERDGICCPGGPFIRNCGGVCTDYSTSENCGTCGNKCRADQFCGSDFTCHCLIGFEAEGICCEGSAGFVKNCNGVCTSIQTDENCGACGRSCRADQFCGSDFDCHCLTGFEADGICCEGLAGFVRNCNGVCTNIQTVENCGACGAKCSAGQFCGSDFACH